MSENKSLNLKIEELNRSVEWFYSDDFNLDEAVKRYKEAIKMAQKLQKELDELKNEIEIIGEDFSK